MDLLQVIDVEEDPDGRQEMLELGLDDSHLILPLILGMAQEEMDAEEEHDVSGFSPRGYAPQLLYMVCVSRDDTMEGTHIQNDSTARGGPMCA